MIKRCDLHEVRARGGDQMDFFQVGFRQSMKLGIIATRALISDVNQSLPGSEMPINVVRSFGEYNFKVI